jgi:Lipocalin-like domain
MKNLSIISVLFFLFIRCNKNGVDSPTCTANAATIAGTYITIAFTYKETPTADPYDIYAVMSPCEKDDLIILNTNNTCDRTEGEILCSPPRDESGNWSISGSTLNIDDAPATIKSFDCKTLVLVQNDLDKPGDQLTITLQKQ